MNGLGLRTVTSQSKGPPILGAFQHICEARLASNANAPASSTKSDAVRKMHSHHTETAHHINEEMKDKGHPLNAVAFMNGGQALSSAGGRSTATGPEHQLRSHRSQL